MNLRVLRKRSHQSGTAVIVVLIILAILMIYVAGNIRTLHHLGRELKLLDQKQQQRFDRLSRTNVNTAGDQPRSVHLANSNSEPTTKLCCTDDKVW